MLAPGIPPSTSHTLQMSGGRFGAQLRRRASKANGLPLDGARARMCTKPRTTAAPTRREEKRTPPPEYAVDHSGEGGEEASNPMFSTPATPTCASCNGHGAPALAGVRLRKLGIGRGEGYCFASPSASAPSIINTETAICRLLARHEHVTHPVLTVRTTMMGMMMKLHTLEQRQPSRHPPRPSLVHGESPPPPLYPLSQPRDCRAPTSSRLEPCVCNKQPCVGAASSHHRLRQHQRHAHVPLPVETAHPCRCPLIDHADRPIPFSQPSLSAPSLVRAFTNPRHLHLLSSDPFRSCSTCKAYTARHP